MKKRIQSVSILQCGIVCGLTYGLLGCIAVPFGILFLIFGTAPLKIEGIVFIFAPILYGGMGFLASMLGALVYNLIANLTGGIEFTVVESP